MASLQDLANNLANYFSGFGGESVHSFREPGFENVGKAYASEPSPTPMGQNVSDWPGYTPSTPLPKDDWGAVFNGIATAGGDLFNSLFTPPPTQGPKMWREPTNEVLRFNDEGQIFGDAPAPTATPRPVQAGDPNFRFAFETMPLDEGWTNNGPRPNFNPKQPPADIAQIIRDVFPDEATKAATVAVSENGRYASGKDADNVWNKDGSIDRGIYAINSNTFNGLMERQGDKLRGMGINSFEDMHDPRKNAEVAKLIRADAKQYNPQTDGWGRWFGWQDVGYDLNNGWFSKEDRGQYEVAKKRKKK